MDEDHSLSPCGWTHAGRTGFFALTYSEIAPLSCQKIAYLPDRSNSIQHLAELILEHAQLLPEGALVAARNLLPLGMRAEVD